MRVPLGFADARQLLRFVRDLGDAREGAGGAAHIIGTAATFYSYNVAKPSGHCFDKLGKRTSDVDVVLRSYELLAQMKKAGGEPDADTVFGGKYVWLRNDGPNGFLTVCPAMARFAEKWARELRRPVDVRLLLAAPDQPSHLDSMLDTNPPPIELYPFAGIFPPDPQRFVFEEDCRVVVSDAELRLVRADGSFIGLPWEMLDAVDLETTSGGPAACDVFWVLGSGDAQALVPQGAEGEAALVDKLTALEGFDHEVMIEAMSSTEDRIFTCWRKD